MNRVYSMLLFLVGVIKFLPVIAVISIEKINLGYGVNIVDPNLEILLRHRAILFGSIGGFVIFSVFRPKYQMAAMLLAAISMLGYLYLFLSVGGSNQELFRIALADMIGVALLAAALVLKLIHRGHDNLK